MLKSRIAVIIASKGRPEVLPHILLRLAQQSRRPEHVFFVVTRPEDATGIVPDPAWVSISVGRSGLTLQRNDGLDLAGSNFDYIAFFDDDFLPARHWLERAAVLLDSQRELVGCTGTLLADGTACAGIPPDVAGRLLDNGDEQIVPARPVQAEVGFGGNVGCNMIFRRSAISELRFDERLPAYAWLEDADFRGRAARQGAFVRSPYLQGVHLGHSGGRSRGVPLGYSQIINSAYLGMKGTVPRSYLARRALLNLVSNAIRSVYPDRYVDRRGRLLGNIIAIADLLRSRVDPGRATSL